MVEHRLENRPCCDCEEEVSSSACSRINKMRGKSSSGNMPSSNGEQPTQCMVNLSLPQMKPGDIAWSRINGGSWWPVQVVDEKCVALKPKKKNNDQVLVRVYGTFEHLYLEPANCVLKLENVYGQENCSSKEVFKKALEEGLARMKSPCRSKRRFCESKENEKDEAPRGKSRKEGKLKKTLVADSPLVVSSDNQKAAEQIEVVIVEDMDAVQASADGLEKRDEMKSALRKRRTRSETFRSRNAGKSVVDKSNEAENTRNGPSMINFSNKKDSMNSRHKDADEKVTGNIHDRRTLESKCVKQDSGCSMNENVWSEFSDVKNIKKFVAKIVKEVAAEKAQNEALEGRGMQGCPEDTKCMESSRKDASKIKHMNKCSPRRVKDKDSEVSLTKENTDDPTRDEIAGLSGVGKPTMAEKVGIGASPVKFSRQYNLRKREFVSANNGMSKDTVDACSSSTARKQVVIDLSDVADQGKKETQAKQGGVENSSGTEMARNGDRSCRVIKKNASREQMESRGSTKFKVAEEEEDLSLRSTRVMQTLGLIAPPGSPFSKNG